MADRNKERLDLDWHTFLDQLNGAYEDAYRDVMQMIGDPSKVARVTLVGVMWPDEDSVSVHLGVHLAPDWRGLRADVES